MGNNNVTNENHMLPQANRNMSILNIKKSSARFLNPIS